ncbi:unnamed protein product [Rhizophagus irregularis]|uniref:Uncharacterized protein n=1 Tax=Rhizophagus irregularis TaxID=588596 RepID=A0A916EAA7_9GLOM|nr:unnamed protein product [Rhizophagus irregularis]
MYPLEQSAELVFKCRLEFYGQNEEKNVDDNTWPAEEISHTIIIPPNLHPSSSNGHDESEKDIHSNLRDLSDLAEKLGLKTKSWKSVELFRLTTTDAESDAEGLDGDEQMSASDYEKLRQRYNNRRPA